MPLLLFIILILILWVVWGSSVGKPWASILDETFENRQRKIGNQKIKSRKWNKARNFRKKVVWSAHTVKPVWHMTLASFSPSFENCGFEPSPTLKLISVLLQTMPSTTCRNPTAPFASAITSNWFALTRYWGILSYLAPTWNFANKTENHQNIASNHLKTCKEYTGSSLCLQEHDTSQTRGQPFSPNPIASCSCHWCETAWSALCSQTTSMNISWEVEVCRD